MKTVSVATVDGQPLVGEQLATFAEYVRGQQFRFIVVRLPDGQISLTHRESGSRVATLLDGGRTSDGFKRAGREAISALIARHGEDRVRCVLAAAV